MKEGAARLRGRILGSPEGPQDHRVGCMVIWVLQQGSRVEDPDSATYRARNWRNTKQLGVLPTAGGLLMGSVLDGDARKSKEEDMNGR